MSKKLIVIITLLFAVQIGVYTITHLWDKENSNKIKSLTTDNQNLTLEFPDYKTRENLDLSNRNLTKLPDEIKLFKNLKSLYLDNNQLTEFPYEVLDLEHLRNLFLNGNQISTVNIKSTIKASNSLITLEIANNQLTEVNGLKNFPNLIFLDLSNNGLSELSINNSRLNSIKLDYNNFRMIPDLKNTLCQYISLSNNKIETLDFLKLPYSTQILALQNNEIFRTANNDLIPYFSIEELDLSQNAFTTFPHNLLNINNLNTINLNQNEIYMWSSEDLLTNESIKKIDLSFNELLVFFGDLNDRFPNLQTLILNYNNLAIIDFNHDNLSQLQIQNNPKADCNLKLKNLNELRCDYAHIETENRQILAPNVKDLVIYNTEIEVSAKVLQRYPYGAISYE